MPDELRARLKAAAERNGSSLNSEIVNRLEASLEPAPEPARARSWPFDRRILVAAGMVAVAAILAALAGHVSRSSTGDIYAATDFGVDRLIPGSGTWIPAADDLPKAAVYALTLAPGRHRGDRLLYAATHGRGAWRAELPDVKLKK